MTTNRFQTLRIVLAGALVLVFMAALATSASADPSKPGIATAAQAVYGNSDQGDVLGQTPQTPVDELASTSARFLGEAARAWADRPWLAWAVVAGGVGQAAGLGLYFWTMWTRIRPVGSRLREARGERF